MKESPPLILASASPRRAELLTRAGYKFKIIPSAVDEPARRPHDIPLDLWPTALAFLKAHAVQKKLRNPRATILGADTIVLLDNQILGKPRNRAHARHMLQKLSGRRHQIITGLALLRGNQTRLSRATSTCRIRRLTPQWLNAYLATHLWQGKAGAYGIQDGIDPFVTLTAGEWSNVVGLPLQLLAHELAIMNSTRPQLPQE